MAKDDVEMKMNATGGEAAGAAVEKAEKAVGAVTISPDYALTIAARTEPILQFFQFGHLPLSLQEVSMMFGGIALKIAESLPRNAERTVALRKLLEAKDAAVRARLMKTADELGAKEN